MKSTLIEYFFNTRPQTFAVFGIYFFASAVLSLVIAIIVLFKNPAFPTIYKKMLLIAKTALIWYGIVSLFLFFLRQQRIPYLSMRIWLWVWVIGFGIITFSILFKEYRKIPLRKEKSIGEMKRKRYFES